MKATRTMLVLIGVAAVLTGVGLVLTVEGLPRRIGAISAHIDWAAGHREMKIYGTPGPSFRAYAAILERRYGVTVTTLGCVLSRPHAAYVDGYDAFVEERLRTQYGSRVLQDADEEAQRETHRLRMDPGERAGRGDAS
jgi:hypothetical protein